MQRWHIYFHGHVQGVGFRFTTRSVADRFDVSGWVKNLSNGTVEMTIEGTPKNIESYIAEVTAATHGRVTDTRVTKSSATGEFSEMEIRY